MPFRPRTFRFFISVFALLALSLSGCATETPLNIPTPSAEAVARQAAITKRVEELKKTHPDVPTSVLYGQATRELPQGNPTLK